MKIFAPDYLADVNLTGEPTRRILVLVRQLISVRPEVIHVHGSIYYVFGALLYKYLHFLSTKRIKIIFTFHTQPVFKSYLDKPIHRHSYVGVRGVITNFLLHWVDEITVVSESIARNLNQHTKLNLTNFSVVSSGVDNYANKKNISDFETVSKSELRISTIGVFSWDWKIAGHLMLIKAIKKLREERNVLLDVKIIGDGEGKEFVEKSIIYNDLQGCVNLVGYVDDPREIMLQSDIYIHTGLNEGCPLAILEAMSIGLPVFAVNAGGNSDLITNNKTGYLFDESYESLTLYLKNYLDKKLANDVGSKARFLVEREYSWKQITQQYIDLYQR